MVHIVQELAQQLAEEGPEWCDLEPFIPLSEEIWMRSKKLWRSVYYPRSVKRKNVQVMLHQYSMRIGN